MISFLSEKEFFMYRFISLLIVFCLVWTQAYADYDTPGLSPLVTTPPRPMGIMTPLTGLGSEVEGKKVIQVSPQELARLKSLHPEAQAYVLSGDEGRMLLAQRDDDEEEEERRRRGVRFGGNYSGSFPSRVPSGNWNFGGGDSGDAAMVILVLAAVVVVAVVAVYAVMFIWDLFAEGGKNTELRFEIFTGIEAFKYETYDASNNVVTEEGSFQSKGIVFRMETKGVSTGLQIEGGQIKADFLNEDLSTTYTVDGQYAAIGPVVTFGKFNRGKWNHRFNVDVLGGTTEHEEVGLMSIARFGYSVESPSGFGMEFTIGSLYLNLKSSEGLSRHKNDFNLTYGARVGWSF